MGKGNPLILVGLGIIIGVGVFWASPKLMNEKELSEYKQYSVNIEGGSGIGFSIRHMFRATWGVGDIVESAYDTYYYDDGSYIKEMPFGALFFDGDSHYFLEAGSETLRKVTETAQLQRKVETRGTFDCEVMDRTSRCQEFAQLIRFPDGNVLDMKGSWIDFNEVLGSSEAASKIRQSIKKIIGPKSADVIGVPINGEVDLDAEEVAKFKFVRAARFSGKQSVREVVKNYQISADDCVLAYYQCLPR